MDETDRENPFIEQESENVWVVDGRFPVEDAAELGWPVEDSADYETIAGWLMSMLDSVPQWARNLRSTDTASRLRLCAAVAFRRCAWNDWTIPPHHAWTLSRRSTGRKRDE